MNNIPSLTPHLDPFPEYFGLHRLAFAVLIQDAGGGETVQHGLNGGTGVAEFDVLQSAAVHELHTLAELAFFKAVPVGYPKMLLQKGGQVEVIL